MSSRHSRSRNAKPTVTQLLGTNEPSLQAEAVNNLLFAAKVQQVFVMVAYNLIDGNPQIFHTANISLQQFNQALEMGHQYVVRQQIEIEKQERQQAQPPAAAEPLPPAASEIPDEILPAVTWQAQTEGGNPTEGGNDGLEQAAAAGG